MSGNYKIKNRNNLAVTNGFNQYGLPTGIQAGTVQNMEFSFNPATGNLTWRKDNLAGRNFTENFSYGNLDRLTNSNIGSNNYSITYYNNGNINTKYDAGVFNYGTKPHAVTELAYSPITATDQNITYTSFSKPSQISEGSKNLSVTYGVDNERIYANYIDNSTGSNWERVYMSGYEEEWEDDELKRKLHYISGGDGLAAVYITNAAGTGEMFYVSKDYLGNIMLLTRQNGTVAEEYSYDAWGRRRNPNNWNDYNVAVPAIMYRGYTGHEHWDEFELICMNGRIYDPLLGRFLSPDNFVQAPGFSQSYNRYAYCVNNPLKYIDPNGEFFREIFGLVGVVLKSLFMPFDLILNGFNFKKSGDDWLEGVNSWAGGGMSFDNALMRGTTNQFYNNITGQPGAGTSYTYNYEGVNYSGFYFDNLFDMVNFMWTTSNKLSVNVEISGYILIDKAGNYYYWVNDWTENTNEHSVNPYYVSKDPKYHGRAQFDSKFIVVQIHTHPKSYYEERNASGKYDGPSIRDYRTSVNMNVPVYSIGPQTVSVITPKSPYKTENDFDNLVEGYYGFSSKRENRLRTNPFYFAETEDWLKNPTYILSW